MGKVCKFPEDFQEVFDYISCFNMDIFGKDEKNHLVIYSYDEKHRQLITRTYIKDDVYNEATYTKNGDLLETVYSVKEELD